MITVDVLIIFAVVSILIVVISIKNIFNLRSHGFYRFLSWECIAWIFAVNYKYWLVNPFGVIQIISWILLIASAIVVTAGVIRMKKTGGRRGVREDAKLYSFERTTDLIDSGIFKYIRHPLYASLLYLTWGIFFKRPTIELLIIAVLSSVFLYITARYDENECSAYFGVKYGEYMKKSKRFVPWVF